MILVLFLFDLSLTKKKLFFLSQKMLHENGKVLRESVITEARTEFPITQDRA